ncbi:MAG: hypothetical protein KAI83_13580 [Thiomargarita sp.]|nr:hypothetical protein [Thiomargarita sp.]
MYSKSRFIRYTGFLAFSVQHFGGFFPSNALALDGFFCPTLCTGQFFISH